MDSDVRAARGTRGSRAVGVADADATSPATRRGPPRRLEVEAPSRGIPLFRACGRMRKADGRHVGTATATLAFVLQF